MGLAVKVISGVCPISGRTEYSLWSGLEPMLPANVYLRSLDDYETGQVHARAYQLLPFFRYLAGFRHYEGLSTTAGEISFWGIRREDIEGYREDLKRRVSATVVREWRRGRVEVHEPPAPSDWVLSHRTADSYLMAAYELCLFWSVEWVLQLPEVIVSRGFQGAAGYKARAAVRRPRPFSLRVPRKYQRRRVKGLPAGAYEQVWAYLESQMPEYPDALDARPRNRTEARHIEQMEQQYDLAMMRYLRDKAIWAFLMATGFRRGEVLRVRTEDFFLHPESGGEYVRLVDRPEDAARVGTELKTGEAVVYIGHSERFLTHIRAWRELRGLDLARARRQVTGKPEHPMLFSNDDGGPLTIGGLRAVFKRIDAALGLRKRGFAFSPHVCRHTLMTILRSKDVPAAYRQWHFRHRHQQTSESYGSVFEGMLEAAINAYHTGSKAAPQ
jgi:integrase